MQLFLFLRQKHYFYWYFQYSHCDLIGNARADSVIYDLAPAPTGRKGRHAKHGKRLSADDDFTLSDEKINGYYIGVRRVLTNLFGSREVLAYVTTPEKTLAPEDSFSAPYFRNSCRFSAHGRKKNH